MAEQKFTTEELANEIWKPIAGYEGFYSVSNLGRVMRCGGTPKCKKDRVLRPRSRKKDRYKTVVFSIGAKHTYALIHCVVARAFIGPLPEGKEVNHIDRMGDNNRSVNLEYLTRRENVRHSMHSYMQNRPRGIGHPKARFSDSDIRHIRHLKSQGQKYRHIAKPYGASEKTIAQICNRETWKHIL